MLDDSGGAAPAPVGARGPEPRLVSPSLAGLLALSAATLYCVGYVVANVHHERYELVRPELFRARYLGAALLFASLALIPGYAGWWVGDWFRFQDIREKWFEKLPRFGPPVPSKFMRQSIALGLMVAAAGVLAAVMWGILRFTGIGNVPLEWVAGWAFVVQWPFATSSSLWTKIRFSKVPAWSHVTAVRAGFVFFCVIGMAGMFGRGIYPYISPAFGGGLGAVVRIYWKSGAVPADLEAALSRPVALLDRDEQLVDVVACTDPAAFKTSSIALPSAEVQVVVVGGLLAIPDAKGTLCNGPAGKKGNGT
jgi:hypothetical protein